MKPKVASQPKRGGKGFRHAAGFVARDIREAAESRGFAVSRVVTHWADIAGADIASITQTAPEGFADGRLAFETAPSKRVPDQPSERVKAQAAQSAAPVENSDLRRALTQLGENVLKRTTT